MTESRHYCDRCGAEINSGRAVVAIEAVPKPPPWLADVAMPLDRKADLDRLDPSADRGGADRLVDEPPVRLDRAVGGSPGHVGAGLRIAVLVEAGDGE
jgi:hypothetical protein